MFDSITFKPGPGIGPPIDIGALAEALIFYRRVIVIGTHGTLKFLLSRIQPFVLLELVRSGRIDFQYQHEVVTILSQDLAGGGQGYDIGKVSMAELSAEAAIVEAFIKATNNTSQGKLGATQFLRQATILDYSSFNHRDLLGMLADETTSTKAIRNAISICAPEYQLPAELRFKLDHGSALFQIDTNINFDELNRSYHKRFSPSHSTMTVALLLSMLQSTNEALHFGAVFESELSTTVTERQMILATVPSILRKRTSNDATIGRFLDLTLEGAHTLREAINSGRVPFANLVRVVEAADRFKGWIQNQTPAADIVREYHRAAIANTWIEKLPTKTARWGVFTSIGLGIDALGAGGAGTLAATAVSAFDSFLFDKIVKGWKPHHFVQSELAPLLQQKRVTTNF